VCGRLITFYGIEPEGSFGIKGMLKEVEDQQERASRRAGASRSLERLIERGLLACCGRGSWRLTPSGLFLCLCHLPLI
jgi:hypothetical protein